MSEVCECVRDGGRIIRCIYECVVRGVCMSVCVVCVISPAGVEVR